jgi:NADPH-dependent ferric siderophore reductase
MAKSAPRKLGVVRSRLLTPHMLRLTLGGQELAGFPDDSNSAYIKLKMTSPPPDSDERPMIRTYTVRAFNADKLELDVDFVMHADQGPASDWAHAAKPGDEMVILGPGPKKLVDCTADWFLLAGDMSALPAISANIEAMPADARGHVLLEIIDAADEQELDFPPGIEVRWIVNPHPDSENTRLLDAVRSVSFLEGRPSIWIAGEFSTVLAIRSYFKKERGVDRKDIYVSSYWQMGQSEDEHRVSKSNAKEL